MPRKGTTNNPSGRPKGTPNKLTKEIRSALKDAISGHIDTISETLDELPPKDRIEMLIKLLTYILPKVESVSPGYGEPFDFDI